MSDQPPAAPTRAAGYRLARGKGEANLAVVASFLDGLGIDAKTIDDAHGNRRHGDLRCACGSTIEVKGQPVDPSRHARNFVEVFECTGLPRHRRGIEETAGILRVPIPDLLATRCRLRDGTVVRFADLPGSWSVSIHHIHATAAWIYVNAADGWIIIQDPIELLRSIRTRILTGGPDGIVRGVGRSNEDTVAVFVDHPVEPGSIWRRDPAGIWRPHAGPLRSRAVVPASDAASGWPARLLHRAAALWRPYPPAACGPTMPGMMTPCIDAPGHHAAPSTTPCSTPS